MPESDYESPALSSSQMPQTTGPLSERNRNVNVQSFLDAAPMQAAHDYVPPGSEKDVLAHTKLLGPGESDTITFTAPFIPGDYVYLCSFPGHYAQGTKGSPE